MGLHLDVRGFERLILWIGLAGTAVFVLVGTWYMLSTVWARSLTQTLEVSVISPFLAAWVLAPLFWTIRPSAAAAPTRRGRIVGLIAAALLVGVAVYGYVPEFVVLPFVFDTAPGLESLLVVVVVPAVQWAILGASGLVGLSLRESASASD